MYFNYHLFEATETSVTFQAYTVYRFAQKPIFAQDKYKINIIKKTDQLLP
jgi:hypothetical protein